MARSALDDIVEVASFPRGIPASANPDLITSGLLVELDATRNRAKVSVYGSPGVWMVAQPSADYVVGGTVTVMRSVYGGGDQYLCLGPIGGTTEELPEIPVAPPSVTTAVAVIKPEWTGTWRQTRYDNWNTSRTNYGGRATLYQGNKYGSGVLTGLATYGDQIVNLGAISIASIAVTLREAGLGETTFPPILVRAASNATPAGAPSPSGVTMSATQAGRSGVVSLNLDPSVLEGFRTGTHKALALAGTSTSDYAAVRGTTDADGMALTVTYTRAI